MMRAKSECSKCAGWEDNPPVLLHCAHFGNDSLYLMDWQHEAREGERFDVWFYGWTRDEQEYTPDYAAALEIFARFERQLLAGADE